jgi:peptidoglycan/xylan/chitin deacetylase (PgdA/CDA1 family)
VKISIDDGCADDFRVAELASKYDIECIFYWPVEWNSLAYDNGYEPLTYNQAYDISSTFEIGSHTITHRHLTRIPPEEAKREIADSQLILQDIFGIRISKFAPPRGYTNDLLTKYTKKFYEKQRLTKAENLVHIHPESGANGNIGWRARYKILKDNGIKDIECWGHSWEFNKYNLWEELEDFLRDTHSELST